MPKTDLRFDPVLYAPVAERIRLFYASYPDGRILSELVSRTPLDVVFKAMVYRSSAELEPAATGWSAEREGDGDVNQVACLENAETSAVGRALANLGFTAARERPSAEEMEKAERARARLRSHVPSRPVLHPLAREPSGDPYGLTDTPLQTRANQLLDLMLLVDAARGYGLRARRAERWRDLLRTGNHAPASIARWEERLREWVTRAG